MKSVALLSLLICLVGFTAHGQATDRFTQQSLKVLSGRVHKILEFRLQGLEACTPNLRTQLKDEFGSLPKSTTDAREAALILDLYRRSAQQEGRCQRRLDQAENRFHASERRKFSWILEQTQQGLCFDNGTLRMDGQTCLTNIQQVVTDLDPHCVSIQVENPYKYYDSFPCMAGDYQIGKFLLKPGIDRIFTEHVRFIQNFNQAINGSSVRTEIDLYQLFRGDEVDSPDLRERFLAMTELYLSSTTALSSYTKGYHDHFWRQILMTTGDAEQARDVFVRTKIFPDEFKTLMDIAKKKKIQIHIDGEDYGPKNRHDFMAAYLACHYRNSGSLIRESLPKMLGVAYEAWDFKSHLQEGLSWEKAKENFVTDTNRYRTGVRWGVDFCRLKTRTKSP